MNRKLAIALTVGLILGLGGGMIVQRQPEVQAQEKQKKQQWEYKIAFSSLIDPKGESKDKNVAASLTDQYNGLAAEGWEYVGPVADRTMTLAMQGQLVPTAYGGVSGAFVMFKRPKQ